MRPASHQKLSKQVEQRVNPMSLRKYILFCQHIYLVKILQFSTLLKIFIYIHMILS